MIHNPRTPRGIAVKRLLLPLLVVFTAVAAPLGQGAASRMAPASRASEDLRDLSKATPESAEAKPAVSPSPTVPVEETPDEPKRD